MRKIVMLKPHEWLQGGYENRDAPSTFRMLERELRSTGTQFSTSRSPVRIANHGASGVGPTFGGVMESVGRLGHGYAVVAEFEDEEAEARFVSDRHSDVQGVFSDPQIEIFHVVNPTSAVGTAADVYSRLNLATMHQQTFDGNGVRLMVVDNGVDRNTIAVAGGFSPNATIAPGGSPAGHGTMVAFDAKIAAPKAMVYDYPLLRSNGTGQWVAFLSDAIRVFSEIMIAVLQSPGPAVVVNSWGLLNRASDAALGNPQNYGANPQHPFNQLMTSLTGAGIDVIFAAGNCGASGADVRCGAADRGPGQSIHGANSHPSVTSVGAITVNDDILGCSSEGPGMLSNQKPDLVGYSHFAGSGVFPVDSGTSAAAPVVAGVVAALRSTPKGRVVSPAQMQALLARTARNIGSPGWDPQSGAGVIDPLAALNAL